MSNIIKPHYHCHVARFGTRRQVRERFSRDETQERLKITVKAPLTAEMDEHLGYVLLVGELNFN